MDLAANEDIVNKSGAWYAYNGDKIGQGRENAKQFLKENPDLMEEISQKVRDKYAQVNASEEEDVSKSEKVVKSPTPKKVAAEASV